MASGDDDLQRVREEITKLLQVKYRSEARSWSATEVVRYRNLCELEHALLAIGSLDSAAS